MLQKLFLIPVVFVLSLFSCKERTVNFAHPIPNVDKIINKTYAKQDNNTLIINHLNRYAYYTQAVIQTQKENWNSFVNYYLRNIKIPDELAAVSVKKYIDTILANNDIVLLNETHDLPQHRVLAHSFLTKLRKYGYKYIAIEALNNNPEKKTFTNNLLNYNSAIYTKEPAFVNFTNSAKIIGFDIIEYEPFDFNRKIKGNRDYKMAQNIKNKCDLNNGKIFIYCGWGHLENTKYRLRYYLNEIYPQNKIVSINQTWLDIEHSNDYQNKIRQIVGKITYPSFLLTDDNKSYTLSNRYDFEIINPDSGYNGMQNIAKIYNDLYKKVKIKNPLNTKSEHLVGFEKRFNNNFNEILPSIIVHDSDKDSLEITLPLNNEFNFFINDSIYLKELENVDL